MLSHQADQITPTTGSKRGKDGDTGKFASYFLTMKQLTDLLANIAALAQVYTKDLVIKKTQNSATVDADLTVATSETSTTQ